MNLNNKGFITKIIVIVVALVALKYYLDFDIVEWVKSPTGQKIVGPVWNFIKAGYEIVKGWVS